MALPLPRRTAPNPITASAITGKGVFTASAIGKNAANPSWVSLPSR